MNAHFLAPSQPRHKGPRPDNRAALYPSLHGVLERYNTMQCNAMQCNAMQWHSPTLEKTLCHAPFLAYGVLGRSPCHPAPSSEHTVLLFLAYGVFGRSPCHPAVPNAMECNIIHYNTMQCNALQYNAMQCNAMQWHSPALEKTLCHAPFLAYGVLGCSPCHPAPSSEHTVMASEFERAQIPRPAVQYNAMQCNATQWHSPALEKTLCRAPFLAYGVLGRSPCHPAPSSEHTVMASEF